jgi:CMP-N,N'-diacetyllegionaminic acid synthase
MPSLVALIPARRGSQRVKNKNIRLLGKYPLIAYTIAQARTAGCFSSVIVSTDCEKIAEIAKKYGAEVPELRPAELAQSTSPDIEWVQHLLKFLENEGSLPDAFSILRPTSPFRRAQTISQAWNEFKNTSGVDSLRAVEKCLQHPGKMWVIRDGHLLPILPFGDPPWHSSQYQSLPEVYIQNASLEIAWSRVPLEKGTIAGSTVLPWISEEYDGFDINTTDDWKQAESIAMKYELNPKIINYLSSHENYQKNCI